MRAWTSTGARDVREEVVVEKTKGTMVGSSRCWPATRGKREGVMCATGHSRSNTGLRNWTRALRLCLDSQREFVCATRVKSYARTSRRYSICRRLDSLRAPSARLLSPAEMIFMMKIWRAEVLELLHPAVAPASRPGCRRSRLEMSFESSAHTATVRLQPGDQPAALLRGLWTRVARGLGCPTRPKLRFTETAGYGACVTALTSLLRVLLE